MLLKISKKFQENIYARVSFLIKPQTWDPRPAILLKKRLWHRCFPVNFAKFLRTSFLQKTSRRLLLKRGYSRWPYFGLYFYPCFRNITKIKDLKIFYHLFLDAAQADDTTFLFKNKESIEEVVKTFTLLSFFSGLKPNISKCEICGLGPLKGMELAVCGMQSIDLTRDTIKILGLFTSRTT